ncbi:Protein of unknown function [Gryllus bimaculatus]|nr:Protein of unknown function [Gryllus bimaculatus]
MARAFFVAATLMLIGAAMVSQAFSVNNLEYHRLQHSSRRVQRSTEKHQATEYSMPVDLSDRYRPKFEYAVLCSNLTIVEDEEEAEDGDENDDSSSSSSEEDTHESDSEESGEDQCLRGPYHDLNEVGLPEPEPLFEHVLQLLNRDGEFKTTVKDAVKTCHKKMVDTVHKYGLERLNLCLLLEIVDECLEYEIGLFRRPLRYFCCSTARSAAVFLTRRRKCKTSRNQQSALGVSLHGFRPRPNQREPGASGAGHGASLASKGGGRAAAARALGGAVRRRRRPARRGASPATRSHGARQRRACADAGRIQTRRKRGEDPEEEQFCCWFPWNATMVQPYITCGILDRRQKRPCGVPVYSDAGEPNFSEATYCRNGSAAALTTSAPASDDSEEDAVLCTAAPSDDCRIRCIYSTTGVLNAQRRPRKRRLAMHWIKRLNSTAGFEIPIKQAVDLCLSLHDRLIQENGAANVDMCVLQTQLHYCIEENVGRIVAVVDAVVKVVDIVVFVTEDMAVVAGQSCDSQL